MRTCFFSLIFFTICPFIISRVKVELDAITNDDIVLIHDDLLATGGSMKAAYNLVKQFNPKNIYIGFLIELRIEGLHGRETLGNDIEIETLIRI